MNVVHTLLDRELLLSGLAHELRGSITAVQGYSELDDLPNPGIEAAVERLGGLVGKMSETAVGPTEVGELFGVAIRTKGPLEVLHAALDGLVHTSRSIELDETLLTLTLAGVPASEQAAGWSFPQVQGWLARGGPGLAGARLRIAARIVGATRFSFTVHPEEEEAVVTIAFFRG